MVVREILLTSAFGLVLTALAQAQAPAAQTVRLSADERAAALTAIQGKFQELYVFPAMRPAI
jgi:hypothetical protein